MEWIQIAWQKFLKVTSFSTIVVSEGKNSFSRNGKGSVMVEMEQNVIFFHEEGDWKDGITFSNKLRWTKKEDRISLEHIRYGIDHPIYLFSLVPQGKSLVCDQAHLCGDDTYLGSLKMDGDSLNLQYAIQGPSKLMKIFISYR